ncbi:MAG: hypothetical protein K8J31_22575 [Anaerolineae bacterium]|nr:hypothetical protein [Anaerolineae bacterium]
MIVVGVPAEHLDPVLEALAAAGAGVVGNYTHCAFTSDGTGRFRPSAAAHPAYGQREQINSVPEIRIETFCRRANARAVVEAIRQAHPYEEPVIYLIPLLGEDEL